MQHIRVESRGREAKLLTTPPGEKHTPPQWGSENPKQAPTAGSGWDSSSGSHSGSWIIWMEVIENIRALQRHVVADKWQNVGANDLPVCVPCVHPSPSVSRRHMTGRCAAVINPQITADWETETCHSSLQTEQSGTGTCRVKWASVFEMRVLSKRNRVF